MESASRGAVCELLLHHAPALGDRYEQHVGHDFLHDREDVSDAGHGGRADAGGVGVGERPPQRRHLGQAYADHHEDALVDVGRLGVPPQHEDGPDEGQHAVDHREPAIRSFDVVLVPSEVAVRVLHHHPAAYGHGGWGRLPAVGVHEVVDAAVELPALEGVGASLPDEGDLHHQPRGGELRELGAGGAAQVPGVDEAPERVSGHQSDLHALDVLLAGRGALGRSAGPELELHKRRRRGAVRDIRRRLAAAEDVERLQHLQRLRRRQRRVRQLVHLPLR
mmetsp:Transcript_47041/g.122004  ORF Transcript_47041/g.122004 Transcript_47041/m.122004 type:complete len:278 (+) Transcript_47041:636-1469(+)